jgi:hypothetical protein
MTFLEEILLYIFSSIYLIFKKNIYQLYQYSIVIL